MLSVSTFSSQQALGEKKKAAERVQYTLQAHRMKTEKTKEKTLVERDMQK